MTMSASVKKRCERCAVHRAERIVAFPRSGSWRVCADCVRPLEAWHRRHPARGPRRRPVYALDFADPQAGQGNFTLYESTP